MPQFVPPQRATSMGLSDGGMDPSSSIGFAGIDSPFAARFPLRPAAELQPSYGGNNRSTFAKEMTTPELIRPSPGNPSRQSEPQTAMFNLLATIVGGGVLSLPYALQLTGVVTGIVLIALAAVAGDFSLYMLCSCARRTGQISYVQVGHAAFGAAGSLVTTAMLMVLTLFVIVAYMVLVRDIWAGLVSLAVGHALGADQRNQVLFVVLTVVFPMCLAKDLHALRHFCYVGFLSAVVLTVALGYRSVEANQAYPEAKLGLKLSADSWGDIYEAFPILCLSYLCHFNILSVHSQFVNPTRERLRGLLHGTLGLTAALYITLALCGYLYAYGDTKDDILLNFEPGDRVILLGRVGMGMTMLVAITVLVLPSRDIWLSVISFVGTSVQRCFVDPDYLPVDGVEATPGGTPVATLSACIEAVRHVLVTVAIMGFCLYCALSVPGVAVVWSICGSSVGFMICYLLPAVFYLKIRWHKAFNMRKAGAWLVVVVSSTAMVICTRHAVNKAMMVV